MKLLNGYRMKLLLVGFVAAIVLGGGRAKADFTFGEPTNLGPTINGPAYDWGPCISADGLELYFVSLRPGGYGEEDLWVAKRETIDDDWSAPVNLGGVVNTPNGDATARLSADGLELYFESEQSGNWDIWVTRRTTKDADWGFPVNLGPIVNSSRVDTAPSISSDGLELYFASKRLGGYGSGDLYVSTRITTEDDWGIPINLGSTINDSYADYWPFISSDGLALFFSSDSFGPFKPGGLGSSDIWVTTRASIVDSWDTPVNLGPIINSPSEEGGPVLSFDGTTLYWDSKRPGGLGSGDLYQAPIIPIVDLNSDLKVDLADMHIMVDHWGENYSLCDIGPMPMGDGVVDVQDLIVLAKYLYRLTAHWEFDETEGSIAYDSFGDHDGTLNGNPFWQPTGGTIGGTLLFDGVDDYVDTPFVLNPGKGSFSVFAWVYSWTPGQVIISQTGNVGGTWLGIDPTEGTLTTGFSEMYFGALSSETVITDIQWHHVGFVYDTDSLHRRLYVNGVLVAEDTTVVSSVPSDGGLYIGASKDLDAGSFFSGLIDDVRIYNQALSAEEIAALSQ